MNDSIIEELRQAVIDGDNDEATELAQQALTQGLDAAELLSEALVKAMDEVATLWQKSEYFMSDVILSANAFSAAVDIVTPALTAAGAQTVGKVVIGAVQGDLHDLGKDIVVAMLKANGFEVVDLGVDVELARFVEAVNVEKPDILGIGAYMSSTMGQLKDVIDALSAAGLRQDLKIIVGGVCVTAALADSYGADAYGKDAIAAVGLARQFMGV
ncbi:MAG: corrinoid protein [Coriobacteriales bacterium]|jgi:5-methyltetrahydrofolate--homocysteine methyltransferase|nr:corrinoid protein [Coriobacteriales bacterium]